MQALTDLPGVELSSEFQIFLVGCFGAFLIEFVQWYNLKSVPNGDDYKRKRLYWIVRTIAVFVGGGLGLLTFSAPANALLVLGIGAGWPTVLKKVIAMALALFDKDDGGGPNPEIMANGTSRSSLSNYLKI